MSNSTLKEAVETALIKLGNENFLRLVPELGVIDVSTSAELTNLLLDSSNVVFREDALLKLVVYFMENKDLNLNQIPGRHHLEMEARLSNAELRHVSRYCSSGLILTQNQAGLGITAIDGPSAAHCDEGQACEYLPLVGLVIGHHEGPIKVAMNDLFLSRVNRGRSRNTICTRFLGHLLTLWREIIKFWIGGLMVTDESREDFKVITPVFGQCSPCENAPNPLQKPVETAVIPGSKGKKRARSPEQMGERGNPYKRVAISSLGKPVSAKASPARVSGTRILLGHGTNGVRQREPKRLPDTAPQNQEASADWPLTIRTLIATTPPLKAPPSSPTFDIMEQFLPKIFSAHFGCGSSGAVCHWSPARRLKFFTEGVGNNQILRVATLNQPFRPLNPCSSGLLLELPGTNDYRRPLSEPDAIASHYYTTVVQPDAKEWLYCGEYRLVELGDISWSDLPQQAHKRWVDFAFMRRERDGIQEMLKAQIGAHVSKITIQRGFENGHIKLRVFAMQCVDYHEVIQKEIVAMNAKPSTDAPANSEQQLGSPQQGEDDW